MHSLVHSLEESGLISTIPRAHTTILGLIGDTSAVDTDQLAAMDIVEGVKRVSEPYKAANRKFHTDDTVIRIGRGAFGGGHFGVIAGPCSIESNEQIIEVAMKVKEAGASFLRGGAFKPRTSPYSFQGCGMTASACCWKQKGPAAFPSSPRL